MFFKKWYDKGVKFINDIVNESGEFITPAEISANFYFEPNFLEYLQIRSAIPYQWKQILRSEQNVRVRNTSLKFCIAGKFIKLEELKYLLGISSKWQ